MPLASASPKNSTNVRSIVPRLVGAALRGAGVVAPEVADRAAAEVFFRPRRVSAPPPPAVSGHAPRRLAIDSGSFQLAAWSWGEGPTVLLAHGWEGRGGQLVPFVAPLLAAGLRVITFDQPAHGRSSGSRTTVLDMARAIRDVAVETAPLHALEGLQPAPLHGVVAHSLGGAATALAIRQGLAVRRVALLAPVAEPSYFAAGAASLLGIDGPRAEGMVARVRAELGGSFEALDVRGFARELHVPALVLHDPEDRDVPWEHGAGIAAAWPGARLERLAGLGHRRLLRDEGVIERVTSFLAAP